ncbi:MAG: ComEC/Rec2 family competence protein [Spirochaetia bacterium]|nr:ComEC/Rec2 family competence protein [Spirochaetia bacterium]
MGISFYQVSDNKVLLSTLIIWGVCSIASSLKGQELIFAYLLIVPFFIVIARINCSPELNLTAVISIFLLFFSVVQALYSPSGTGIQDNALQHLLVQTHTIHGCLSSDSKFINGTKQEFLLKVEKILDTSHEFSFSADFEVEVVLYNPNRYFSGEFVEVPGQFVLNESIVQNSGRKKESSLIFYASDIFPEKEEYSVMHKVVMLRKRCIEYVYLQFSELPYDVSELSTALLLGRKEDASNPIIRLFREAGCAHILALSGMHLHVLSVLVFWVLRLLIGSKKSKIATSFSIIVFVWIAGGKPSLIRSMIMFIIISNRRKKDLLNSSFLLSSLTCTLAIQSFLFPSYCSGPGYFLSYSAMLGIVVFAGRISIHLPGVMPPPLRSAIAASLAAFTASSPFLVHYFGEIYPIGIIASIPLTFLITLYMITCIIFLLPFPSAEILTILRKILLYEFSIIERVSIFFSKTPAIIIESNTVFNAFIVTAGFMLLTVFISIEYSIYKNRGYISVRCTTK